MTAPSYILATAGHVDHGKSSLIHALTGTDPDRLPEEKLRGMTIDLGFAQLLLPSPPEVQPGVTYRIGIVDVPGHEDFIRNMVAGVGSIDLALLVVAVDDGWMPQTEEHLQILCYLGISHGLIALTKSDLPHHPAALRAELADRLRGTFLEHAPVIPTSVHTGQGLRELRAAIAAEVAKLSPQPDLGLPRLPVDRVFTIKGVGTVATGTLVGGSLQRGQTVVVQPSGHSARIRSLQTHNRDEEQAVPGSRVAVNLPDLYPIEACPGGQKAIDRGDVITLSDVGRPSATWDVQVHRSTREVEQRPLPAHLRLHVHIGTSFFPAEMVLLSGRELRPGETALAQLRLKTAALALAGDRFILRDSAGRRTLAGGIVLDALALRKRSREPARTERLITRAAVPNDAPAWLLAEVRRRGIVPRVHPLEQTRFSTQTIVQAASHLIEQGHVTAQHDLLALPTFWKDLLEQAAETIDAWHRSHPEQPGLALADLRKVLGRGLPPGTDEAAIDALCQAGFARSQAAIRRSTHRPALPPRLQAAGQRLRTCLAESGLDAPSCKQLAPDPVSQQALRFLIINGEAVQVGPDSVIGTEALEQARIRVRRFLQQHGPATVAQLKTALGSCRRIMVPLLERLDREGVTIRVGDLRSTVG